MRLYTSIFSCSHFFAEEFHAVFEVTLPLWANHVILSRYSGCYVLNANIINACSINLLRLFEKSENESRKKAFSRKVPNHIAIFFGCFVFCFQLSKAQHSFICNPNRINRCRAIYLHQMSIFFLFRLKTHIFSQSRNAAFSIRLI